MGDGWMGGQMMAGGLIGGWLDEDDGWVDSRVAYT